MKKPSRPLRILRIPGISASGQSALEYIVLVTIVIGALVTVGVYFKRGLQGRWKSATDDVGDQYNLLGTTTDITYTLISNTKTEITTELDPATGGYWTLRNDQTNAVETKSGSSQTRM